jgi:hypothetical protein
LIGAQSLRLHAGQELQEVFLQISLCDKKVTRIKTICVANELLGEKTMTCQGEPREEKNAKGAFRALGKGGGRRETGSNTAGPGRRVQTGRDGSPDLRGKPSDKTPPVRKDKVEKARKKKSNGDYDSQEVYRKIAERLMDSFGI